MENGVRSISIILLPFIHPVSESSIKELERSLFTSLILIEEFHTSSIHLQAQLKGIV